MMVSCSKNIHKANRSRKIWLDACGIPYVVLIGDPYLQEEYAYDSNTKTLTLRCMDDYEHLSTKVYMGVRALHIMFRPTGILKVDDDVLVRVPRLQEFSRMSGKPSYVGTVSTFTGYMSTYHKGKCTDTSLNAQSFYVPQNVKYCFGAMYYIDAKAIRCLIKNMDPKKHIYEDVLIGMVLNACKIYPVQFPWLTEHLVTFLMMKEYIAFHDVRSTNNFTYIVSTFDLNKSIGEWMLLFLLFYICILLITTLILWNAPRIIMFK